MVTLDLIHRGRRGHLAPDAALTREAGPAVHAHGWIWAALRRRPLALAVLTCPRCGIGSWASESRRLRQGAGGHLRGARRRSVLCCLPSRHAILGTIGMGVISVASHSAFTALPGAIELPFEDGRRGLAFLREHEGLAAPGA